MTNRLKHILLLALGTVLCAACSLVTDSYDDEDDLGNTANVYISFAVTFDGGDAGATRSDWWPNGGEHGNRTEAGFPRENMVRSITIMLFKKTDDKGVNTDRSATLDFIRYCDVSEDNRGENVRQNSPYGLKSYSTGPLLVSRRHMLDFTAKYYAIAIANYFPPELANLQEGVATLGDVLDLTTHYIMNGEAVDAPSNLTYFTMGLEDNAVLEFDVITNNKWYTKDATTGDVTYDATAFSIPIERHVARIDFWSLNALNGTWADATKYETVWDVDWYRYANPTFETNGKDKNDVAFSPAGYVYTVYDGSDHATDDRFVITHITPFNLNNNTEYLLKRSQNHSATTPTYLAPEDWSPYPNVLDPLTLTGKTVLSTPANYLNPLSGISSDDDVATNAYRRSVAALHAQVSSDNGQDGLSGGFVSRDSFSIGSPPTETRYTGAAEDIIISYAMENTLTKDANLYYYATGVIIEGDYYKDNDATQKTGHRVYYGFLRHASETLAPNAYDALLRTDFDDDTKIAALKNTHPVRPESNFMHFGVVRNNIYRLHIDKVYQRGGMTLKLVVKDWDVFHHEEIIM